MTESSTSVRRAVMDLALESSSLLFLCSATFSTLTLWHRGVRGLLPLAVAASVPAAASLILTALATFVPGLFAVKRLAYPLNFTLPLVHGSLALALAALTRASYGFQVPPGPLLPALLWDDVRFLALAVGAQVMTLTVLAALRPAPATPGAQR